MIAKELDPFEGADPRAQAGRAAEEQMAFYMKRAFAGDPSILVLNGIRLERDGDAAQIDHLVIHAYGITIVESKSVTGKITVNEQGEWARVYGSRVYGMPSPILQAARQRDFLRAFAQAHPAGWPEKQVGIFVRVAISDGGVIKRPKDNDLEGLDVCKADRIPGTIKELISARKVLKAMPGFMGKALLAAFKGESGDVLTEPEVAQIAAFLVEHHTPSVASSARPVRQSTSPQPSPLPAAPPHTRPSSVPAPARPAPVPTTAGSTSALTEALERRREACGSCGSQQLQIKYGYSYFYHCTSCNASTPIAHLCGTCGGKERTRKDGQRFFAECATCHSSRLFHVNTVPEGAAAS